MAAATKGQALVASKCFPFPTECFYDPLNLKHQHPHYVIFLKSLFSADLLAQARPKFNVFLKYAKVELTPPTPGDIPAIRTGIANLVKGARTGAWKNLTVKEAWLNTLVTAEVLFWFYVGECIGKRHLVGYDV